MKKPGRASGASLSVAQIGIDQRLPAPASLTEAQRAVWVDVVNARPADWFCQAHEGLLSQYCRHKVMSDVISAEIEKFDPRWMVEDEGVKRLEKLGLMLQRETSAMNTLMRSMRMTQQSLMRAEKSVNVGRAKKPWERD